MDNIGKPGTNGFNSHGFSLIELLVAMAIFAVLMASVTMAFHTQQQSQVREQMVLEMQQNVRGALQLMEREIRMAGYDPTVVWGTDGVDNDGDDDIDESDEAQNDLAAALGITMAQTFELRFGMDLNGDRDLGESNERIAYGFANKFDGDNGLRNGLVDYVAGNKDADGAAPIGRASGGANLQGFAEDIEAVAFAYAFDMDMDGRIDRNAADIIWAYDRDNDGELDTVLDTNGDGAINAQDDNNNDGRIGAGDAGSDLTPKVPLNRIRAVKIWLLARTPHPVRGHRETRTYVVGDKIIKGADMNRDGSINDDQGLDHYQRRLLSTTVICRNMGLGL